MTIPLSEDEFVEEVHGSGVLVYLSATWLCEVYQQVITTSILEVGGYEPSAQEHNALVNLLIGALFYIIFIEIGFFFLICPLFINFWHFID